MSKLTSREGNVSTAISRSDARMEVDGEWFKKPLLHRVLGYREHFGFILLGRVDHGPSPSPEKWMRGKHSAFNFVLRGKARLTDTHGRYLLGPGSLYRRIPGTTAKLEILCDDFAEFYLIVDSIIAEALHALHLISDELVVDVGASQLVIENFEELWDLCARPPGEVTRRQITLALIQFLGRLMERAQRKPREGYWPGIVFQAAQLLERNLNNPVSPADLARELGVSYTALRRAFREIKGESIVHYRIRQRLHRACELLGQTSVKETSAELGYSDPFTFSKQFREYLGLTPSAFQDSLDRSP